MGGGSTIKEKLHRGMAVLTLRFLLKGGYAKLHHETDLSSFEAYYL
jgi:hypothetical protein